MTPTLELGQRILNAAKANVTVDLGIGVVTVTKPIVIDVGAQCTFSLKGSGHWAQVRYNGPTGSTFLTVYGAKRPSIEGLGLLLADGCNGVDFVCDQAHDSTSHVRMTGCHIQGKGDFGVRFGGDGDCCDFRFDTVECYGFKSGFKPHGSNCLNHVFMNCQGSSCDAGFDLTEGGAASTFFGCGGSNTGSMWKVNGGYCVQVFGGRTELVTHVMEFTWYSKPETKPVLCVGHVADSVSGKPFEGRSLGLTTLGVMVDQAPLTL